MTPVLCLNCGKARSEHVGLGDYCFIGSSSCWAAPPLDESAIEQRTVEQIATWISQGEWILNRADISAGIRIADAIRSGAWKVKP